MMGKDYKRPYKGKSIISFPSKFVVIDLETTGLSPEWDEIIEVAALRIQDGEIIASYQSLVKPNEEIDEFITELTGITVEMLSEAPSVEEVLPAFRDFIGDDLVVGHNVSFDVGFIYDNFEKYLGVPFSNNYIDTMRISRKAMPELAHHRLKDMVNIFNIVTEGQHRALADCHSTYSCFFALLSHIQKTIGTEEFIKSFAPKPYNRPKVDLSAITAENVDFDETHPLYGKRCVFTGALEKMIRTDAAQLIVNMGGICENTVTKQTNYLILGNNDYCKTIKDGKSAKQKKAEAYKLKGCDIEIISENVFYDMLEQGIETGNIEDVVATPSRNLTKSNDISKHNESSLRKPKGYIIEISLEKILPDLLDELAKSDSIKEIEHNVLITLGLTIHEGFLKTSNIRYANKRNKDGSIREATNSEYRSIVISAEPTPYRLNSNAEPLLCRVKFGAKSQYISFAPQHKKILDKHQIPYVITASDSFLRISLSDFFTLASQVNFRYAINEIFAAAFNFDSFGCCSRYKECSEAGECLHDDLIYASAACQYKKHLDKGEIFYK